MEADAQTRDLILKAIPQQAPFRFIDEILELDEAHVRGAYRFKQDEFFYQGHFPGWPITPGVILIETMAQSGIVALGIYIINIEKGIALDQVSKKLVTLFSLVEQVEFLAPVFPGDRVIIEGEKMYYRRGIMKARVSVRHEDGRLVCSGVLSGVEQVNSNA